MPGFGVALVIVCICVALVSPCGGDTIRVRSAATVAGTVVRLSDVADLEGDAVAAHASQVVAVVERGADKLTITQQSIRDALSKAGINWARVTLAGYDATNVRVHIDVKPAAPLTPQSMPNDAAPADTSAPALLLANPTDEISADAQLTVSDRLIGWLEQVAGVSRADLRIKFAERDAALLAASAVSDRLVFVTSSSTGLGRVPVTVQRFRGEKLISTDRLTAEVARRQLAVVVIRPVERGATVAADDVAVRETFLDKDRGPLCKTLDDAVGQVAQVPLREGSLLAPADLRPALMVRRNEDLDVQVISGTVVVKLRAKALEDGATGQMIKVRGEYSREVVSVRVIGNGQAVLMVKDAGQGAAASNK